MAEIDLSQFEEIPEESPSEGVDLSQFEEINPFEDGSSPTSAMPESPVGLMDRAKLALGNVKGNVNYLKKSFEDVQYSQDKGIVVKEKGVWKQVDPSALGGDGWTISEAIKDIVEGGASLAAPALGAAAGAAKGAAIGGATGGVALPVVGAIPGAAIGGIAGAFAGGASGKVAMSSVLGRYVGTYQPESVQDELEDIALEGLFAAGGEVVRVGAKPTFQALTNAYKSIGRTASEGTKDALAATLGRTTAAGEEATRFMFENTDDVARTIKGLRPESRGTKDLIQKAAERQLKMSNDWLEQATQALPRKYGALLDDLSKAADEKGLSVNVGETIGSALSEFQEQGFGKIIKGRLIPFTEEEIAERVTKGLPVEALDRQTFREVARIHQALQPFSKVGTLQGSKAAKTLHEINKKVNQTFSDNVPPVVARAKGIASSSIKTRFGEQFEKAGLSEQWSGMNQLYQTYGDAVSRARKLLNSPDGAEQFFNNLLSQSGKKVTMKQEADLLAELAGEFGSKAQKEIMTLEAAKRFAPLLPKMGVMQSAAGGAGLLSFATGATNPIATAVIGATFSPRTMLGAARGYKAMSNASSKYAMTFVQALKTLSPKSLKQAMSHPDIIRTAAMATMHAMSTDEEDTQRLIEQAAGE